MKGSDTTVKCSMVFKLILNNVPAVTCIAAQNWG